MLAPARLAARRRARLLLLAVLVSCLGLVGMRTGPGAGAADAPPLRIRMFGDSVMLGARDDLMAALPGTDTYVDAVESRSLLGTTPILVAHPDLLGDVVVLDLGYNDMADPAVFRERVDAMMQALASVPRVVWLTQSVFQPARGAMNDELRAAADRYPNLDVVDWDAQVAAHPEYVYADGLHLTPAGRAAFAAAVQDRIAAYRSSITAPAKSSKSAPATVAGASATRAPAQATTGDAAERADRAVRRAERRATAGASSPAEDTTGRTVAAVAIGLVALVVIAGVVLLRRSRDGRDGRDGLEGPDGLDPRDGGGQSNWQRPVPTQRLHSGAPPVA